MKWICVATAPNEPIGESWAELLRSGGVPAFVRSDTVSAYIGSSSSPVRIMVPEDREGEGKAFLADFFGPEDEEPEGGLP